jgi:hypothetical protein
MGEKKRGLASRHEFRGKGISQIAQGRNEVRGDFFTGGLHIELGKGSEVHGKESSREKRFVNSYSQKRFRK